MADLTVTSNSVLSGGTGFNQSIAGEDMTGAAGLVVYLDGNDLDANGAGKAKFADANDPAKAIAVGITVNRAFTGQPVLWASLDADFTPGATLVPGQQYILSGTGGGKICPLTDLASGWRRIDLFAAKTTTKADLNVRDTGIVI